MTGLYRQLIPYCAEIANHLNPLLRKGEKWRWGLEQQDATLRLSSAINDAASLHLADLDRTFDGETEASDTGLGTDSKQNMRF